MQRFALSLRDPVIAAVAASLLLALVELASLGAPSASLAAVVVAMHAGLGLAVGAALSASARFVSQRPAHGRTSPWIHALASIPPLAFASRNLFEGARAATLPGPRLGHVWLATLGYVAVAAAVAAGTRLLRYAGPRPFAALLAIGAVLAEIANRSL